MDYHFVNDETFLTMVESNELLEHAEVFGRHRYGTPRAPVEAEIEAGRVVILDIDVQGLNKFAPPCPKPSCSLSSHRMKAISKRGFEVEDEMKKTPSPEDWPKHAKSDSSRTKAGSMTALW